EAGAVEAELKRFEGTWGFESLTVQGRVVPLEGLKTTRLTLKGDTFEMTDPMATYRGTFRPDPSFTPRRIDMTFTEGPEAGKAGTFRERDREWRRSTAGGTRPSHGGSTSATAGLEKSRVNPGR